MQPSSAMSEPEVVIAVDLGTTFSGFAYARTYDVPPETRFICQWPGDGQAGAKAYCKNQSSLFYTPNPNNPHHYELQAWGWNAFNAFRKATRGRNAVGPIRISSPAVDGGGCSSSSSAGADAISGCMGSNEIGPIFCQAFKLYLAPEEREEHAMPAPLPGDLTPQRLVVDYLQKLSEFIMEELKAAIRPGFSRRDVQWCLTVPAIWDEQAKQIMRTCAEEAGMVKGPKCPSGAVASPRPVKIILEPEAASVYCQQSLARAVELVLGDRVLVADVGGGTIDLVVHEILELHSREGAVVQQVREAAPSYGETGGGIFVDKAFYEIICQKIGCFNNFSADKKATHYLQLYSTWQDIKAGFDGSGYTAEFQISATLKEAWQAYDRAHGGTAKSGDFYDELCLGDTDLMTIFDPEVNKVLHLIEKEISKVKVLMVVGGFAQSRYLRKRVNDRFRGKVEQIIIPDNPGSAICRGAVLLSLKKGYIKSRISKRTYGLGIQRDATTDDMPDLVFVNEDGKRECSKVFDMFVRKGASVEMNACIRKSYQPGKRGQDTIKFSLYSSPQTHPRYTNEPGVKEEGQFQVHIPRSQQIYSREPKLVHVDMVFGDSLIAVTAFAQNSKGQNNCTVEFTVPFQHK